MPRKPPQKNVVIVDPLSAADVTTTPYLPATTTIMTSDAQSSSEVSTLATSPRPVPESELTPEQRRIRELEDQLAREQGKKDPEIEYEQAVRPGATENILIHFLEDGFTALNHVWYRGQELEFQPNGQSYKDTCDRNGRSWLELRDNEFAQVEKYGRIMFRTGPWPGKALTDAAKLSVQRPLRVVGGDQSVPPPTVEELEAAERAEAKRQRAAPRLPVR